jgi:hypothetical protein
MIRPEGRADFEWSTTTRAVHADHARAPPWWSVGMVTHERRAQLTGDAERATRWTPPQSAHTLPLM